MGASPCGKLGRAWEEQCSKSALELGLLQSEGMVGRAPRAPALGSLAPGSKAEAETVPETEKNDS